MNNAAINVYVQVFVWMYVFVSLIYKTISGFTGSYGNLMFNFLKNR